MSVSLLSGMLDEGRVRDDVKPGVEPGIADARETCRTRGLWLDEERLTREGV